MDAKQKSTVLHYEEGSGTLGARLKKSATTIGARLHKKQAADNLLFCRYELKYRISESKAAAIEQFIRPYLHLDRYTQMHQTRMYPIVSLYLDSSDLKLCRETITGKKNRFKLRIRAYSDDQAEPRFIEIKRRANNVIIKSRVRATSEDVAILLSSGALAKRTYEKDEQFLRQFELYMNCLNAKPVVLVRYIRRAYEGDSDNRVRITFDRELCFKDTKEPRIYFNGDNWQRVPLDCVILEIKFTARYPAWLSRMAKHFDLPQQSMSKYVASLKQSHLHGFCGPQSPAHWAEDTEWES